MKLVIDIDEYYYRTIKSVVDRGIFNAEPWTNIANGTPLPKGHGELKDVSVIVNKLSNSDLISDDYYYGIAYRAIIDDSPTIIEADKVEPLTNGDWHYGSEPMQNISYSDRTTIIGANRSEE